MSKVSYRAILVPSLALMAIGLGLLSQMTVDTTTPQLVLYMIITGTGMGALYPVFGTAAQSAVEAEIRGAVTSFSQFFRSIGGTIGVSVLGSLLIQLMVADGSETESRVVLSHALNIVFQAALGFALIALMACFLMGKISSESQ
mgnify:CR=1 FL=1|jgi:hypothetical protein